MDHIQFLMLLFHFAIQKDLFLCFADFHIAFIFSTKEVTFLDQKQSSFDFLHSEESYLNH